jgi:hypothetical protein
MEDVLENGGYPEIAREFGLMAGFQYGECLLPTLSRSW